MRSVHRVEVLIIDHDDVGADGVRSLLENTKYPNRAIRPHVMGVESREVDWSDEHPLNNTATFEDAYRRLFGEPRDGDPSPSAAGDGSVLDRLLTAQLDSLTPPQARAVRAELKRWVESVGRLHDVWRSSTDTLAQLGLVLEAEGMRRMALHHEDPWHAGFMIGEAFALLRASKLLALMASAGRMREHRDEQHEGTAT